MTPTQPAVALSFLCILLDVLQQILKKEHYEHGKPDYVQPQIFYNGTLNYYYYDRVGGILSHLKKVFSKELSEVLDESQDDSELANDSTDFSICKLM